MIHKDVKPGTYLLKPKERVYQFHFVSCDDCGGSGGDAPKVERAAELWNKRSGEMKPEPAHTCETCWYWMLKGSHFGCGWATGDNRGKEATDTCRNWTEDRQ